MENKFHVVRPDSVKYKTLEEAVDVAKQYTAKNDEPYAIAQVVALTKTVVPDIEVIKIT